MKNVQPASRACVYGKKDRRNTGDQWEALL